MARRRLVWLFPLLLLAVGVAAQEWSPTSVGLTGYQAEPVWRDEFATDGPAGPEGWTPERGHWPFNGELQEYTDDPSNTVAQAGLLRMRATLTGTADAPQYRSSRWSTRGQHSFRHGLFAARMRLPQGQGVWPFFRLLGDGPRYVELNVAELIGGDGSGRGNDGLCYSVAWHQPSIGGPVHRASDPVRFSVEPAKLADDFHVFWLEWTHERLTVGLDSAARVLADVRGVAALRDETTVHLVLGMAIGGEWPGSPDQTTQLPQEMHVDWVRVWAKEGQPGAVGAVQFVQPQVGLDAAEPGQPPPAAPAPADPTPANPEPQQPAPGPAPPAPDQGGVEQPGEGSLTGTPRVPSSGTSTAAQSAGVITMTFLASVVVTRLLQQL